MPQLQQFLFTASIKPSVLLFFLVAVSLDATFKKPVFLPYNSIFTNGSSSSGLLKSLHTYKSLIPFPDLWLYLTTINVEDDTICIYFI